MPKQWINPNSDDIKTLQKIVQRYLKYYQRSKKVKPALYKWHRRDKKH